MRETQFDVLSGLMPGAGQDPQWLRPQEFGGRDGSHHGQTATRMAAMGWVERNGGPCQGVTGPRGSYRYRITPKGMEAWANHNALKAMAKGKRT